MELLSSDTPRSEQSTDRSQKSSLVDFDQSQSDNQDAESIEDFFKGPSVVKPKTYIRKSSSESRNSITNQNVFSRSNSRPESEKNNHNSRNALLGSQHLTSKSASRNSQKSYNRQQSNDDKLNNLMPSVSDEKCGTYRIDDCSNGIHHNKIHISDGKIHNSNNESRNPKLIALSHGYSSNEDHENESQSLYGNTKFVASKEEQRQRAAHVVQTWWRRVRIRKTAGAAAMKRMMEQKQTMLKERLTMERETVCFF